MTSDTERYIEAHKCTLVNDTRKHGNKKYIDAREKDIKSGSSHISQVKECYNCHKPGHVKQECRNKGGGKEVKCAKCSRFGHEANTCRSKYHHTAAAMIATSDFSANVTETVHSSSVLSVTRGVGVSVPKTEVNYDDALNAEVIRVNWITNVNYGNSDVDTALNTVLAKVGDHVVKTLRDSGCSAVCANKNIVRDDQLTGEKWTVCF